MNTCKTCKHWSTKYFGQWGSQHVCHNRKIQSAKFYQDGARAWETFEQPAPIKVIQLNITTGPNFGCIHWESKA